MKDRLSLIGAEPVIRVMAIDSSLTACGVLVVDVPASYRPGDIARAGEILVVQSEVLGAKLAKASPKQKEERIDATAKQIASIAKARQPDFVLIEGAAFGANGMLFDLGAVHYAIRIALRNAGFPAEIVQIATGRKAALGVGRNPTRKKVKEWVEIVLRERHGLGMDNEHLNDALVLVLAKLLASSAGALDCALDA